jgi:hypothetical protein
MVGPMSVTWVKLDRSAPRSVIPAGQLLVVEAFRGSDDLLILNEAGIPLARITAQEAVEVVEAPPRRPPPEGSGRPLITVRRQMPLAERRGAVSVL